MAKTGRVRFRGSDKQRHIGTPYHCPGLGLGPGASCGPHRPSFVASANCGLYCGAAVDHTWTSIKRPAGCAPTALQKKLEQSEILGSAPEDCHPGPFGWLLLRREDDQELGDRYGFKIIEDASHAVGATYEESASRRLPVQRRGCL